MFRRLFGWFMCEDEEAKARWTVQMIINTALSAAAAYGKDVRFWTHEQIVAFVQDISAINPNKEKRRRK